MIQVYVKKLTNCPVSAPKVKKILKEVLTKEGIVSKADVSVSFVSQKHMLNLAKKYLNEREIHVVLTFPYLEGDQSFIEPPDETIHLGDIVICYPKVVKEAGSEGKLIDEKVLELVEHGALHLMGKHHN